MITCIASLQAGAIEVLQAIMDTGVENVATDRAKFILTWLTVGADQDDFKAPQGDKTFEGKTFRIFFRRNTCAVLFASAFAIAADGTVSTVQMMTAVAYLRTTITTLAMKCSIPSAQFDRRAYYCMWWVLVQPGK